MTRVLSATDTATPANTGSADATVTVVDMTAPAVTAPPSITVEAEGTQTAATTALIAAFLLDATAVDVVDGDLSAAVVHNAPATFGLGATVVTFSATDTATPANTGSADATVTVVDMTAPAVTAPPSITVEAEGTQTAATTALIAAFLLDATAVDVVDGDLSAAVVHNAPATFGLGATVVTFSATDTATPANTGSADATVTVVDMTAPAVTAPPSITVEAEGTQTAATTALIAAFLLDATAVDVVDGDLSAAVVHNAPATFGLGATVVIFSATDTATPANTGSADATVTVVDMTAPAVTAPPSITVEAEGTQTAATTALIAAFLLDATAVDVVDGDLSAAVVHNAPATFGLGATVVTFSATDTATPANTGSADATVTVVDMTAPAVTAPPSITVEAEGTQTAATTALIAAFLLDATAVDVVDGDLSAAVVHNAPATFGLGATVVTFSATDTATPANTGSADATVTVVDMTAPAVTAPPSITVEAEGTQTAATTALIAAFLLDDGG